MNIYESWLTDIQNAYSNGVQGRSVADMANKPKYIEVSSEIRNKLVETMKDVTKLVNEQINSRSQSYSNTTGLLMLIADINQLIDKGNFFGCRASVRELLSIVKATNKRNSENGYEPILNEKAISNLEEIDNLFGEMCSTVVHG